MIINSLKQLFFQKEAIETLSYCLFNNRYPVINKNRGTPNLPIVKDKKQKNFEGNVTASIPSKFSW